MPHAARARLADALCSNTAVLCAACGPLGANTEAGTLGAHRGALKAYSFFLVHLALAGEAEAKEAGGAKVCPAGELSPPGLPAPARRAACVRAARAVTPARPGPSRLPSCG